MKQVTKKVMETDVLVIGGGLAGINAAIGASEKGARVLVVDKGSVARSGCIGGISAAELEKEIKKAMGKFAGPRRNEKSLSAGLDRLKELHALAGELTASDYHELMRVHEAQQLLQVGEIMIEALLFRKESRFGIYHHRTDYPETDDRNWLGQVLVSKKDNNIIKSFKPLNY